MPNLLDYENTLNSLLSIQSNIDKREMMLLYGDRIGSHLFEKFVRFDRNIINLYSALDKYNRLILLTQVAKLSKL
jgi:hypothetical protein